MPQVIHAKRNGDEIVFRMWSESWDAYVTDNMTEAQIADHLLERELEEWKRISESYTRLTGRDLTADIVEDQMPTQFREREPKELREEIAQRINRAASTGTSSLIWSPRGLSEWGKERPDYAKFCETKQACG